MTHDKNYYNILELDFNSTMKDIHMGYQKAKNAYSGDSLALYSLMTKDECRRMLDSIDEAYNVLSDPVKRAEYDRVKGYNTNNTTIYYSTVTDVRREEPLEQHAQGNISKMVAKKRFALEFTENPDFEKEIADATEFTGPFLRKIREYKNVDIPRMVEMTRVSKNHLLAIENEDLAGMPALVYVRGFVYQYAKSLRLNPDIVTNSYMTLVKAKKVP